MSSTASKMRHLSRLASLATFLMAGGCQPTEQYGFLDTDPDGTRRVPYRGRVVTVERHGDLLLYEGDIEVTPDEAGFSSSTAGADVGAESDVQLVAQALKIAGANFKWTTSSSGATRIPWQWAGAQVDVDGDGTNDDLSSTQKDLIKQAMTDWEQAVDGLDFKPRNGESSFLSFQLDTVCSSPVGKQSAGNTIRLASGCIGTATNPDFAVHHEIGHSLGMYHQHTRKDAISGGFVTVNWGNVLGCPDGATSAAQCGNAACTANPLGCGCTATSVGNNACDRSFNFSSDTQRSNIGAYDYDSVMHYPTWAFAKCRDTMNTTVLCDADGDGVRDPGAILRTTLVAPAPIGQRDHLSGGDSLSVNVMYPGLPRVRPVLFEHTGMQPICTLDRRLEDVAISYDVVEGQLQSGTISGNSVDTDAVAAGSYDVGTCTAQSVFWDQNYNYPNTSVNFDIETYAPQGNVETYTVGGSTVRVFDRGLIAVLF